MGEPRSAEIVSIAYFAALSLMAWWCPVPYATRARTSAAAAVVALAVAWVAGTLGRPGRLVPPAVRDWLPLMLLLLAYWLPRALVSRPRSSIERVLLALDAHLVRPASARTAVHARIVRELLEAAYLAVYPMVPVAFTLLLAAGRRDRVDWFWSIVLTSEYLCYLWLPVLPSRPPRDIEPVPAYNGAVSTVRRLNLWILGRASNRWNTFPSGHVAGAFACALAVLALWPAAGVVLLALAVTIGVASVAGRYHYAGDALAGAAVAAVVFLLFALE